MEGKKSRSVRWHQALCRAQRRWRPAGGRTVSRQLGRRYLRGRSSEHRHLPDEMGQFTIGQDCATPWRMSLPSAVAAIPARSRGRLHPESDSGPRGPRDIFQRDRDRLIHSVAFRRLRHKTQVFVAPDGDHYRVRLTHSLEVAQIGRTIARALGLNEDLTEALCLAHDLGHPPFGHAGEYALDAALTDAGGFDHNAHTIRIVTRLETPYPDFDGLNLSWEALEGLAKHNGPVLEPTWAMAAVNMEWR